MPAAMAATTPIFEDADPAAKSSGAIKGHNRTPSVGEILRGRKNKENDPSLVRIHGPSAQGPETPLGERHINSPQQPRRVPLKDDVTRPPMHKKTKSNGSLKSLVKHKSSDSGSLSSSDGQVEIQKPKKSKSSANLAMLFKRKPKRDLSDETPRGQEQTSRPPYAKVDIPRSPVRTQFTSKPSEEQQGKINHPPGRWRTFDEDEDLHTPKGPPKHLSLQQNLLVDIPKLGERSSGRPFFKHQSSHSSISQEESEGKKEAQRNRKQWQHSASNEGRSLLESQALTSPQALETNKKQSSTVPDTATQNPKARPQAVPITQEHQRTIAVLSEDEVQSALESLLDARNIAPNMRNQMRALDISMKLKLIQNQRDGSGSSSCSTTPTATDSHKRDQRSNGPGCHNEHQPKEAKQSRSRPRSRAFTLTKRSDGASPTKKQKAEESIIVKSKARPLSVDMSPLRPNSSRSLTSSTSISSLFSSKRDAAAVPGDFIHYLREVEKPELIEIGKMHKLRILLRNESVSWTDTFVKGGGMDEVVKLLYRIIRVEWREEHEDTLLHETLLCLKGLCTTSLALERLAGIETELFPKLLGMLFDEEKKGPSEFSTRCIIVLLLFAHLSASLPMGVTSQASRARTILCYLQDPTPEEAKKPFDFIEQMHVSRPYRVWCKEVVNVTKEVFWIFLHHLNVIPIRHTDPDSNPNETFADRHFPPPRAPHPAAPYVGGVEWEATSYLATHLDLLNGLLASLATQGERNALREDMRASGWEKVMGGTMRTCKEKFYGGVHEGLKVWVAAAKEDGWPLEDVRAGPPREASSPRKGNSPMKKKKLDEEAPKIRLDVGVSAVGGSEEGLSKGQDAWI